MVVVVLVFVLLVACSCGCCWGDSGCCRCCCCGCGCGCCLFFLSLLQFGCGRCVIVCVRSRKLSDYWPVKRLDALSSLSSLRPREGESLPLLQ